jgi:hypothetical protein
LTSRDEGVKAQGVDLRRHLRGCAARPLPMANGGNGRRGVFGTQRASPYTPSAAYGLRELAIRAPACTANLPSGNQWLRGAEIGCKSAPLPAQAATSTDAVWCDASHRFPSSASRNNRSFVCGLAARSNLPSWSVQCGGVRQNGRTSARLNRSAGKRIFHPQGAGSSSLASTRRLTSPTH